MMYEKCNRTELSEEEEEKKNATLKMKNRGTLLKRPNIKTTQNVFFFFFFFSLPRRRQKRFRQNKVRVEQQHLLVGGGLFLLEIQKKKLSCLFLRLLFFEFFLVSFKTLNVWKALFDFALLFERERTLIPHQRETTTPFVRTLNREQNRSYS